MSFPQTEAIDNYGAKARTHEGHLVQILVMVPSLLEAPGGVQTYSQALVAALSRLAVRHEWTLHVIALNDRSCPPLPEYLDPRLASYQGSDGSKMAFLVHSLRQALKADVIIMAHVHFAKVIPLLRIFAPDASVRVAMHGIEVWKRLGWLTRLALRNVDQIWPVSKFTQAEVVRHNPSLAGVDSHVLCNTLGPLYTSQNDPSISTSPPVRPLILCVSRMATTERDKNIDVLIRAMPLVIKEVPEASLTLVGPDHGAKLLRNLVSVLKLKGTVTFTGQVSAEELSGFYKNCLLFALPSTKEGFGIVFLEAMYFGKACVGAAAGGIPEVIEDGVTGFVVKAVTPEAVAAVLIKLLKDDVLRHQMGAAGQKRLHDLFANARFEERIESLMLDHKARRQ